MPPSAKAGTATSPSSKPKPNIRTTQETLTLRVLGIWSSLSSAIRRANTRWEPRAPRPQPAVESRKTRPTALPFSSVNGFQKPVAVAPRPWKGSSTMNINNAGRMAKPASIIRDWNTSVRETARKPPMKV